MRECLQKQCGFLLMKNGCRRCSFCSADPFIVAEDCPTCFNCENIPNACRWEDDNETDIKEQEQNKPIEEKPMEMKQK
jgi:hypothetical protein